MSKYYIIQTIDMETDFNIINIIKVSKSETIYFCFWSSKILIKKRLSKGFLDRVTIGTSHLSYSSSKIKDASFISPIKRIRLDSRTIPAVKKIIQNFNSSEINNSIYAENFLRESENILFKYKV